MRHFVNTLSDAVGGSQRSSMHDEITLVYYGVRHVPGMGPQYVNVCEVNQSSGSTYVTNWGFPEADQFVHRGSCHG